MTRPARERGAFILDAHKGIVGIDIETCSAAELKDYGSWAYSLHDSTRVWVVSFAYFQRGEETKCAWRWYPGDELLPELLDYLQAGGHLLAHNLSFEVSIWENVLRPRFGFPEVGLDQWQDTQAIGCEANLPASLQGLTGALGTETEKDLDGAKLMKRLARATETSAGRYIYPQCDGADLERLSLYCDDDVLAMGEAWLKMTPLPVQEQRVFELDKRVNSRGVYLDQEFARKVRRLAEQRKERLAQKTFEASTAELANSVSAPALKRWLKERGVDLPTVRKFSKAREDKEAGTGWYESESTDKRAIDELLQRADLPGDVREVLLNRQEATKETSLRKLKRVETMVGADGRLRHALQYCAAGTGRWSSSGLQIHNLPKDKLSPLASDLVDLSIERGDIRLLEIAERRPLEALSQKLRSIISAAPGHELIAADFSSIEACVCAWLAGQEDKLEFLHTYFREIARYRRGDRKTKPQDLYEFAAESIGSDSRQLGKVAELALQFGMGDFKFADTASAWGVPLDLRTAAKVKRAWRGTNVMIVKFWADLEGAAISAVQAPGSVHRVGKLRVFANVSCLFVELPSGRRLRYWRPEVHIKVKKVKFVDAEGEVVEAEIEGPCLSFWSQNDAKTAMTLEETYGGKLVENATQAVARELLADAMLRLDPLYPIVIHVHDSAASEVPKGTGSVEEFCYIMSALPDWAFGCPVDADGYRAKRFKG